MPSICFWIYPILISIVVAIQHPFVPPKAVIGRDWEVLGPFQSGTREQQWGADPLEAYGGFRNLDFEDFREFPSTLNGSVRFSRAQARCGAGGPGAFSCTVPVVFDNVNWNGLRDTFGWSALQFQAWIRGTFTLHEEGRYGIWIGGAVEFYLDGQYCDVGNLYEADVLQYSRGGLFLDLSAGDHLIEVRAVNDIRAFGGQIPPKVEVHLGLKEVAEELVVESHNGHGGWEVPQIINMTRRNVLDKSVCIAGEWASLAVTNQGKHWIEIISLKINQVLLRLEPRLP